jgi:hypothetical protein
MSFRVYKVRSRSGLDEEQLASQEGLATCNVMKLHTESTWVFEETLPYCAIGLAFHGCKPKFNFPHNFYITVVYLKTMVLSVIKRETRHTNDQTICVIYVFTKCVLQ